MVWCGVAEDIKGYRRGYSWCGVVWQRTLKVKGGATVGVMWCGVAEDIKG